MRRGLILMAALTGLLWGQLVPTRFSLHKTAVDSSASYMVDSTSFAGLASNSVLDIRATGDSLLFFGTSRGLSLTPDLGRTFRSYVTDQVRLPEGGISALAIEGDTITVAGMKDTVVAGSGEVMGTGIASSTDGGNIWAYKDQPTDEVSDTTFLWAEQYTVRKLAITTAINNVTYDVAVSQGTIWAASWAGGLRRYHLPSGPWTPVPLPRDNDTTLSCDEIPEDYVLNPRDPSDGGNHNHKAFSVIAYDSLVWVGTAAGINKGIVNPTTGCVSWTHYKAQWGGRSISGNWVLALHRQITAAGKERVWAATVNAEDPSEKRAVSFTEDGGETWYITLLGKRAHNITSSSDAVYVATDNGLYKSFDGLNWARFHSAVDSLTGEQVWAEAAYGALFDSRNSTLWIGTPDGLARTSDVGLSWEIERSFVSTSDSGEVRFYAYPNPFYPAENNVLSGSGHVRFQYHIDAGEIGTTTTARISIYDFAMDPVISLTPRYHTTAGDFSQVWDGHNDAGHQVANGVYYCRLTLGGAEYWTKVMVIK